MSQFTTKWNAETVKIRYVSGPRNQKSFDSTASEDPATIRICVPTLGAGIGAFNRGKRPLGESQFREGLASPWTTISEIHRRVVVQDPCRGPGGKQTSPRG